MVMKATLLIAAVLGAAIGSPTPAAASPPRPVPFMQNDGTYLVGKDIRSGLYLTRGASGAGICSWTRLSSIGNDHASNVIDHGESSDAQYALIAPSDVAFDTRGCQEWSIGTRPATPIAPVPKTCIYPLTGCVDPNEQ
jgi:hypothetical protein